MDLNSTLLGGSDQFVLQARGPLVVLIGDSNVVGQMDIAKVGPEFGVTTPQASIGYDMFYGTQSAEPVPMTEFGPTTLRNYSSNPGAGLEISCGQTLLAAGQAHYLLKFCITGTTISNWIPGSTYGQASTQIGGGTNLYTAMKTRVRSFLASTGRTQAHFVVNLGTNDATGSTLANAVSANMTSINNQLRSDFPGCRVVWIETHVSTTNSFTSTVRTQQESYASTAPSWFTLINMDDGGLLGDGLHYDADTYVTTGARAAIALADQLGIPRRVVTGLPACVGFGTPAYKAGNVTPRYWPGTQAGDTVYAMVHNATLATASGTPSDWTPAGWALKASATSVASGVTIQFGLFERQLSSGDFTLGRAPAVTFLTPGPEGVAQLYTFRGPNAHPTIDVVQAFVSNTFSTGPIAPTGLTTTVDNCAIAYFVNAWVGSNTSASAAVTPAAGVANASEIKDSAYLLPDAAGGLSTLTVGQLAAHGAIGTSSVSFGRSSVPAVITAAIRP